MSREKHLRRLSDGAPYSVNVDKLDGVYGYRVSATAPELQATVARAAESQVGPWSVVDDRGNVFEATVESRDGEIHVEVASRRFVFVAANGAGAGAGADAGAGSCVGAGAAGDAARGRRVEVKAPMPGKVVKLLVAEGERVQFGQPVLLFEAMKMQNELRSPQDGVIVTLDVRMGQAVESRERLYIVDNS